MAEGKTLCSRCEKEYFTEPGQPGSSGDARPPSYARKANTYICMSCAYHEQLMEVVGEDPPGPELWPVDRPDDSLRDAV